ncbi:hypothetical protein MRM63_16385 [bacterium 19MO03SA05]|uniref:Bacteriophage tail tape measure C-terminal domain-containing protein n=1 Tax=bacterium 19MO03SA05 TaxID=2920620 RepID=A0AAU6VK98_UNCXX
MSNSELRLKLRFDADNKEFIGSVKASDEAVRHFSARTDQSSTSVNKLSKETTAATSEFAGLNSTLKGLAGGFAALLGAGAMKSMFTQQALLIDQTAKHADKIGITTEALTQLRYASELTGVGSSNLDTALQRMTRRLAGSDANTGLSAEVKELGLDLKTLQAMSPDEQLAAIADGFKNVESQATRVKLAFRFFDTEGVGMVNMLANGSAGLREMQAEADRVGVTLNRIDAAKIEAANDAIFRASEVTRALKQSLVVEAAPSVEKLADLMLVLNENGRLVSDVLGVTLAMAAGRASASVYNLTKTKVGDIITTRQGIQATVAKAQAELAAVAAEMRHLEVMRSSNAQKFQAIGGETTLATLKARRKVLTDALTVSQARLNVVMRVGSTLMATLGGPAGIVMMAAGALGYFALTSNKAAEETSGMTQKVRELVEEYGELNEVGRHNLLFKLGEEATQARSELAKTQARIRDIKASLNYAPPRDALLKQRELVALEKQAKDLQASVQVANEAYKELLNTSIGSQWVRPKDNDAPQVNEEAVKSGEKMLAMLSRQVALYGQTSEVAKVRYELEHGELKGINDELKTQLLLQAQLLDSKRPQDSAVTDFFAETDEMESAWFKRLAIEAAMENKAVVEQNYAHNDRLENLRDMYDRAVEAARGNREQLAAIEAEYRYQQEIAEAEHQHRLSEIEVQIRKQREEANKGYWQRYLESAKTNLENFDGLAKTTIDSFSSGMGNTFESMIFDADKLGDALFNLTEGISRAVINALGRMTGEWLAYQAVQILVGKTMAQQQAQMAGINAYTSTAAVPVVGPALAPGAMASALAVTMPMASSIGAMSIAGMAHDGIGRVPKANEGTWLLKQDEMVLNTEQADNFHWMIDTMREMKRAFSVMRESPPPKSTSYSEKPIYINYHGANSDTIETKATETNDAIIVDVIVKEAVKQSLNAVYSDFDNGGPISRRAGVF